MAGLRKGSEAALALRVSGLAPPPPIYLEFVRDEGYLRLPYSPGESDTLALGRDGGPVQILPLPGGGAPSPNHCLFKMMAAFVDARLGLPSPPPVDQPLR